MEGRAKNPQFANSIFFDCPSQLSKGEDGCFALDQRPVDHSESRLTHSTNAELPMSLRCTFLTHNLLAARLRAALTTAKLCTDGKFILVSLKKKRSTAGQSFESYSCNMRRTKMLPCATSKKTAKNDWHAWASGDYSSHSSSLSWLQKETDTFPPDGNYCLNQSCVLKQCCECNTRYTVPTLENEMRRWEQIHKHSAFQPLCRRVRCAVRNDQISFNWSKKKINIPWWSDCVFKGM